MSANDWPSGGSPLLDPPVQANGFTMISTTVDDLSYTPSEEQKSRDAEQLKATGRRSYKTLKGKAEAVWPPALEAALLQALELYHPSKVGSRSDKAAGRFPMRNRFISDYIFEITKKRRTPKQVGSRLQQLRDTCKKEKILDLISHRGTSVAMSTSSRSEYTPDITPDVSPSPPPPTPSPIPPVFESSIHVKISLQSELWPSPTPRINLAYNDSALPQTIQLSPLATQPSQRSGRLIQGKSSSALLPFLSGHIELPSPFQLLPQSKFMVYLAGSSAPIHVEMAPLICLSSPMQSTAWLYSTELVPSFWNQLGSDHDLEHYIIVQTLRTLKSDTGNPSRVISLIYKFSSTTGSHAGVQRRFSDDSSYCPAYDYSCQPALPSPNAATNVLYSQWQPAENEGLGSYDVQPIASHYHVEPSFGTALSTGNPVPSTFTYPQQRCSVPMSRDVSTKYDTHGTCSQPALGSYYLPSSNSNYPIDYSNQAFYLQNSGYSFS
ncbi:hypothetical protein CVT26_014894 [Gymnopilus dilepis]|uniref:TEA domain-containing protein n=1 Tax=Gymnopilus dilepis TaxID=231916 RepID=A0A409XWU3_9AGAR|nr:hypothetical protein CVT26_014894 [Gymnopilus dilepis]